MFHKYLRISCGSGTGPPKAFERAQSDADRLDESIPRYFFWYASAHRFSKQVNLSEIEVAHGYSPRPLNH